MPGLGTSRQKQREKQAEKQRKHRIHEGAQRSMFTQEDELDPQYLQEIVEHGIDEATAYHLQNMLSKDFVLANLENAEVDELKWLMRGQKQKVFAMHPPEDSAVAGDYREFLHDNEMGGLKPLEDDDRTKIDQVLFDVHARVSRSKGGWQQDEFSQTINVSEVKDSDEKSTGGIF